MEAEAMFGVLQKMAYRVAPSKAQEMSRPAFWVEVR
jgi:hypothetical protein